MNISNLKEYLKISNTIKNYKTICIILELKIVAGNSKKNTTKRNGKIL